jgi:hypothetical protein
VTECRKVTVSKWQKFVLFDVCVAGIKETKASAALIDINLQLFVNYLRV